MKPRHLLSTVALFVVVGIGLGLSGYFTLDYLQTAFLQGSEEGFAQSLIQLFVIITGIQTSFVTFLLGSIVASFGGLASARAYSTARSAAISSGVASVIGYPLMVVIAVGIMLLALSGMGGEGMGGGTTTPTGGSSSSPINWGEVAVTTAILCIPTGLVGAVSGYIGFNFADE